MTRASLRRQLGLVYQDTFLISGTNTDNIHNGRLDASDADAVAATHAVNANAFIEQLPYGLCRRTPGTRRYGVGSHPFGPCLNNINAASYKEYDP